MENNAPAPNPIAAQVVGNNDTPNTNGIPGSQPGETRAETQARLYKVTVDGQEMEVDEDELRRGYAHNKAAAKRMEEAAFSRKEAEQVIRLFKENPKEAFRVLGGDARRFAEQIINEELQESMLSPQERELRDYKRRVEEFETERRQAQEQYEQQMMQQQINAQAETIQNDIIGVLSEAGIPKTASSVNRMINYMQAALAAGYNVSPKDVVEQVRLDYKQDMNSLLGGLPEEVLEQYLGAENYRRIAKSSVKKAPSLNKVPKEINEGRAEKVAAKKILSPKDFFKNI